MAPASSERNLEPKSADPSVQADPSPQNFPITDGQAAVQQREAQIEKEREKRASKERDKEVEAGKTTGAERKRGEDLQKLSETNPAAARSAGQGIRIDGFTRRNGSEALTGHYVRIVDGEYAGRYGVYEDNATVDDDGYPVNVLVTTRDDRHERLVVPYACLEPAPAGGR